MGFVFRLEKVANYRSQQVDAHGRRVAAAERVVGSLIAGIQLIDDEIQRHLSAVQADAGAAIRVQPMMARAMWVSHQEALRALKVAELAEAEAELAGRRAELTAAWRDLEVLNKLRERQKTAWQAEQTRHANLAMDEIGQLRACRQRRSKVAT